MAWRDHPYSAEGFLYIMAPRVVFRARLVAPAPAYPLAQITYNSVTVGAYTDLRMGMLMALGSAPGKFDYGMNYVRGDYNHDVATATTLNVGYCSRGYNRGELNLVDGAYITVWDCYPPFKRPSRMNNSGYVYKDYDWPTPPYTSPVAHVGDAGGIGNMALVDGTGYFPIQFGGSGSYPTSTVAPGMSFVWDAADGTYVIGNSASPNPKIKFPAGYRHVQLIAVDGNVALSLPREYLVVALSSENDPSLIPTVNKATWTLKPEGVAFQAEIRERLDPALYLPGSPVMFLVRERYAGVPGSLTGFEVKFSGYLQFGQSFGRSTPTDFERAQTIYAVDAALWLATEKAMPATMARTSGTPLNQNSLQAANLDRFAWWYLFNYTNMPMLTDFQWSETDDDYAFSNFSSPGGNLYGAPDNLSRGIAHRLTSDSRGRLRMKPDPQRLNLADRTSEEMADLSTGDWTEVQRVKRPLPRLGVMRSTFTLTSTTPAADVVPPVNDVNAIAPGIVEGQMNAEAQNSYPWLVKAANGGQEGFDRLGHDYERQNAPEENLQVKLAHGGDNGLEPAAMAWVRMTISEDEVIGLDEELDAERCLLLETTFVFDDDAGTMQQSIVIERETVGTPAAIDPRPETGVVPTTVTIRDPVLSPVQSLSAYEGQNLVPTRLICWDTGGANCHIATAWDPTGGTIVYQDRSTGLVSENHWSTADPYDYKSYYALQADGLYRNPDPFGGGSWTLVANNLAMFGNATYIGKFIALSINRQGYIAVMSGNVYVYSTDYGVTWNQVGIDGAPSYQTALNVYNFFAISPYNNGSEGWIYAFIQSVGLYKSVNWGASWTLLIAFTGSGSNAGAGIVDIPYIRTDGVTPNINDGSQELWSIQVDPYIAFSDDAGATWTLVANYDFGGNHFKPPSRNPATGWYMKSFTYDGSKISFAGKNSADTHFWPGIFNNSAVAGTNGYTGGELDPGSSPSFHVNRYSYHDQSHLFWVSTGGAPLRWTLDDGATMYSAAIPAGYDSVSYVEWSLSAEVIYA